MTCLTSNNLLRCSLVLLWMTCISFSHADRLCDPWLKRTGAKPNTDGCLDTCVTSMTDMGTFQCPMACAQYCKESIATDFVFKISDLYPGLTLAERAIAAENPIQSLLAYRLTLNADSICAKKFGKSRTNDESDACRHFVWAALMRNELGADLSKKILDAHETVPTEPENERAMDLANNREGLLTSEKLIKEHTYSEENIGKAFDEALAKKSLIVLDPKFHVPMGVKP